ncbi:MAG: right-handed parallel beta-helix repeat-containing protein, partial [Bacteroidota bacterium]
SAVYTRGDFTSSLSIYWNNSGDTPIQSDNPSGVNWEVNFSIVEGGWNHAGQGNLNTNPLFVNASQNDFQLQAGSPAINVSDEASFLYTDLIGNPRILNGKSDMGAYEFRGDVCGNGQRLYVDIDASGFENGTSWENAYTDLQDALSNARRCNNVKEIWIAEGTYLPSQTLNTDSAFRLVSGVSLLGGYDGTETNKSERDWVAHETILSGFLSIKDQTGSSTVRSDVVVVGLDIATGTLIDGLTITGGANGWYVSTNLHGSDGAGMILQSTGQVKDCNPTIQNCRFINNDNIYGDGGGIYLFQSTPTIHNCEFINNFADGDGGAIFAFGADSLIVTNSYFSRNSVYGSGGSISSYLPFLEVENCVFDRGFAELDGGGAIHTSRDCDLSIRNCTITNNNVDEGDGAALLIGGTTMAYNSIFWRNGDQGVESPDEDDPKPPFVGRTEDLVLSHCIYQDGWPGFNNLDADPLFLDVSTRDLRLTFASPAINAGINEEVILLQDIAGNPRIISGRVDLGAYEFQEVSCQSESILYVDIDANGEDDGSSWENAYTDLQEALAVARACENVQEIWIAEGMYLPTDDLNVEISFELVEGVSMYGGFNGTETSLAQRDWTLHPTLLSGSFGDRTGIISEETRTRLILKGENLYESMFIDGLVIEGAYGKGMELTNTTNSIKSAPVIRNCTFDDNDNWYGSGGGLSLINVSPVIDNCTFTRNFSDNDGGDIFVLGSDSLRITNSSFSGNATESGGGIASYVPYLEVENCVFHYCDAEIAGGGAIYTSLGSDLTVRNCTFTENDVDEGDGSVFDLGGTTLVYNSIFWRNGNAQRSDFPYEDDPEDPFHGNLEDLVLSHCIYQDGWPGFNNLDVDPLFKDEPNSDLSLLATSPAINAGLNEEVILSEDIAGNPRIISSRVDLGAYEFQGISCQSEPILYVDTDANGEDDGSSWENAFTDLHSALSVAKNCDSVRQIWVAEGTYQTTTDRNQEISFELVSGVKLYGGFSGTESQLEERDWVSHPVTLTGPGGQSKMDRIILGINLNSETTLDGFIITKGYNDNGDGFFDEDIILTGNEKFGSGMFLVNNRLDFVSKPIIRNCSFESNMT